MKKLLPVVAAVLPVMLILSAVRTYRALDAQREVFLRSRAGAVAAQLETLPPSLAEGEWLDALGEIEGGLQDLAVLKRGDAEGLDALWEGRELFRTEKARAGGVPVYRAYVPFHASGGELRLARIDLREDSADFLVAHARHHLWLVAAGGAMIVGLFLVTARLERRAAVAERKQLELAHLAHLGEMSAVLAHEIRNPLGTIKGFAQLLAERVGAADQALVRPIVSETVRLEGLVRDLLLYGRPAEPKLRAMASAELAGVLRQHAGQMAGVDVRVEMAEFELVTDPGLMEQVLLNLLRNGSDAVRGREGARVSVEGGVREGEAVFTVTDNGPGFSDEALARMFEPFFTTKASGTGLGLVVSRKLAEALGGGLNVGKAEGGGARVEVRAPLSGQPLSGQRMNE